MSEHPKWEDLTTVLNLLNARINLANKRMDRIEGRSTPEMAVADHREQLAVTGEKSPR